MLTSTASCIGNNGKNWLLNSGTSGQSEGYSSKWLVCGEPLQVFVWCLSNCLHLSLSLSLFLPPPFLIHPTTYIPGLPLVSLNLMDYCHVTDLGIAFLSSMNTLTLLSLSRTKLTDNGMPFIQGTCTRSTEHLTCT